MTRIAVAIVNHDTCEHLRACLTSVRAEAPPEVVVVDNMSSDGSVELVRSEYPEVLLLANTTNLGYGAAANQAIANCAAAYVLLLNSDTCLRPGALQALSSYLDQHPRAGIVGPRLLNVDGSLQASCFPFPTPFNLFLELNNLNRLVRFLPVIRDRYVRTWQHNYPRVVPWVLGAALAIRREAFADVHGFDESFFMYSEEVDLCYRMWDAGWETHFAPFGIVAHVGGASTTQCRVEMAVRALTSTIDFYRRHYSRWPLLQLRLIIATSMAAKMARDSLRLRYAHDPSQRNRLAEDICIWRRVLSDLRQEVE